MTRFSGTDVTPGIALTGTAAAYPFFAPLLGWLGVALTGSDTSSNAMFGSLQRVTVEQLGLDPLLVWLQAGPLAWMVPTVTAP